MYSYEQVYDETLKYFNGNELATNVWISKYALKTPEGQYLELTPDNMHRRMAREFARIEQKFPKRKHIEMSKYGQTRDDLTEEAIYNLFKNFENIIPQGSIMAVLGDENYVGSTSNCFVVSPPMDSYGGILYTDQQITQVAKRRGGIGFDISTLRPKDVAVNNVAQTTTGAVSFMERFSNTTREIAMNGRRAALMLTMDCRHPDIEDFITIKQDLTKVTGANITVLWTDDFMEAVENDEEYVLHWPVGSDNPKITKVVKAKDIWNKAVESAHKTAEPGVAFIDRIKNYSTDNPYSEITSSNPCIPGFAKVKTEQGIVDLSNINIGSKIWSKEGWTTVLNKWKTGVKSVYAYGFQTTGEETSFIGTENHNVVTKEGKQEIDRCFMKQTPVYLIDENNYLVPTSKVYLGDYEVYDITVDNKSHTFWCGGIDTSNCGEIFMGENDSCRLIALNMFSSVRNPYTKDAYFDFDHWYKNTYEGLRLSDNLVELELGYVERIIEKIKSDPEPEYIKAIEIKTWEDIYNAGKKWRRTGLGFTALGDTLAALGFDYDNALDIVEKIMEIKFKAEWDATTDLAIERGAGLLEKTLETDFTDFIKDIHPDAYQRMMKYGRRSISISTVAPTGCSRGDSLLLTSEGLLEFQELIDKKDKGFYPLEINEKGLLVKQETKDFPISKKYVNGLSKTKIIKTISGLELESTLNHKYRVIDDYKYIWKNVGELKVGDILVTRVGGYDKKSEPNMKTVFWKNYNNSTKPILQPTKMNPKLAKLLGLIYADGSIHIHPDKYINSVRIHMNPNDTELIDEIVKLTEETFGFIPKVRKERTCVSIYLTSKYLLEYLEINECVKQKAHLVEIPKVVRTASRESLLAFVEGYWLADGSQSRGSKYIDTTSKKMAQQLLVVLRALGINSKIQTFDDRSKSIGDRTLYRIHFIGYGSKGFSKYRYISKDIRQKLLDVRQYGEELCFDEIESLTESETFTYDIEVPENNTYVLNSVISHNSVSMLAKLVDRFGTTSGVEPLFAGWYTRRKKINQNEKVEPDFVDDLGDKWIHFDVFHSGLLEWADINNIEDIKNSKTPYITAPEINWEERVKLQAVIQKYISHSISSTTNLPEGVSIDEVNNIYLNAWKMGLKGITVYRDGSRSGVLVTKPDKQTGIVKNDAPKRPKELHCKINNTVVKGEQWVVLVGFMNDDPYEVFAFRNGRMKHSDGILVKHGRGKYDLICDEEAIIEDVAGTHMTDEEQALTRVISLALRHGADLDFVYEQLEKSNGTIVSFSKAIMRSLKKFTKNLSTKEKCPECGEELTYQEGCQICLNPDCVGYSRC